MLKCALQLTNRSVSLMLFSNLTTTFSNPNMRKLTRRSFLQTGAGVAAFAPSWLHNALAHAPPRDLAIGFQIWPIREIMLKDFAGALNMMAKMGYESIELCSPAGYAAAGFGVLENIPPRELKRIMHAAGITCNSCHFVFPEVQSHGQKSIDFASELGLSQMVLSSFRMPDDATLSDWKRAADELNRYGEKVAQHGMQMVYHNHNFEFEELEGRLIYDVLLEHLDPALIKLQFQVWVVSIGYRAADYFRKHPGRFISAHLSDWSGVAEERRPIGQGKVDWKEFFEAGKAGGLENYYVEMDMPLLEESASYLKSLSQAQH